MGDLRKQTQHADDVLRPIQRHLTAAADEMEQALAAVT
jgi:hypothetical protein